MVTETNGKPKTEKKVYRSTAEALLGFQRGDFQVAKEEVAIPEVQEIVIPTTHSLLENGLSGLKKAVVQLKSQRAAEQKRQAEQAIAKAEEERIRNEQAKLRAEKIAKYKADNSMIGNWIVCALRNIHEIQTIVAGEDELLNMDASEDYPPKDGKKLTYGQQMDEWGQQINEYQTDNDPLVRLPLVIVESEFWLSVTVPNQEELTEQLERLVHRKILENNPRGNIVGPQGMRLCLAGQFDELDQDYRSELELKIKTAVENQVNRLKGDLIKRVTEQSNLTFEQFMKGEEGKFLLTVPSEPYKEGENHYVRPGGTLLLEIQENKVFPLEALGGYRFQNSVAKMAKLEIYLEHETLLWKNPPGWEDNFTTIAREVIERRKVPENLASEYVRKLHSFWFMINRGIESQDGSGS